MILGLNHREIKEALAAALGQKVGYQFNIDPGDCLFKVLDEDGIEIEDVGDIEFYVYVT
jgi:hypothetical protein